MTTTRFFRQLGAATVLLTTACGGGSPTGSDGPTYAAIADTYVGTIGGVSQGYLADLDFTLTIAQSGGSLSGTYALDGTLFDGVDTYAVAGTGTITGSIQSGNNPSVNLTIRTSGCPNYTAQFSGTYDTANQRLTIIGPMEFFNEGTCTVGLSIPTTLVMTR